MDKTMGRMLRGLAHGLVLAAAGSTVHAEPGAFNVVLDAARPASSEDSAVHGFVLLNPATRNARAVGAIGRAYSTSPGPDNAAWGMVTEAVNLPLARGHLVGLETAVVNMAPDDPGALRGIDVVFKNRMDVSYFDAVPVIGQNRFNDESAALFVSSQPRSPAGEYSGWQAGIRFAASSLDRSATRPYAAAMDVSEVEVAAPVYLIVWRCGRVKCGLAPTDDGARIVRDIEGAR